MLRSSIRHYEHNTLLPSMSPPVVTHTVITSRWRRQSPSHYAMVERESARRLAIVCYTIRAVRLARRQPRVTPSAATVVCRPQPYSGVTHYAISITGIDTLSQCCLLARDAATPCHVIDGCCRLPRCLQVLFCFIVHTPYVRFTPPHGTTSSASRDDSAHASALVGANAATMAIPFGWFNIWFDGRVIVGGDDG